MVRVSWKSPTGELVNIAPSDGPNQYSDDAEITRVRDILDDQQTVSESKVAAAVDSAYQGDLSSHSTVVSTETYRDSERTDINTTLAFVEISDLVDKLNYICCDECSYSPTDTEFWESRSREGSRFEYTDWICPECGKIVHVEAY